MTQWGLDTLFNPAKRHMDEEKRRLQSTREQIGDSSGGKRIDLESGKVTIRRPDSADEPTDSADVADSADGDDEAATSADGPERPAGAMEATEQVAAEPEVPRG
jgi:Family of unknown function (DUF6191)